MIIARRCSLALLESAFRSTKKTSKKPAKNMDREAVELVLDEHGRIDGFSGCGMDFGFRRWLDCVDSVTMPKLVKDCKAVFSARSKKGSKEYSGGGQL